MGAVLPKKSASSVLQWGCSTILTVALVVLDEGVRAANALLTDTVLIANQIHGIDNSVVAVEVETGVVRQPLGPLRRIAALRIPAVDGVRKGTRLTALLKKLAKPLPTSPLRGGRSWVLAVPGPSTDHCSGARSCSCAKNVIGLR